MTSTPALTTDQTRDMVFDAHVVLNAADSTAPARRLAGQVVNLLDADGSVYESWTDMLRNIDNDDAWDEGAPWTVCEGCSRSVETAQVLHPVCDQMLLGLCGDCASTHYAGCAVCASA